MWVTSKSHSDCYLGQWVNNPDLVPTLIVTVGVWKPARFSYMYITYQTEILLHPCLIAGFLWVSSEPLYNIRHIASYMSISPKLIKHMYIHS